jgi:hypothetical protein
MSPAAVNTAPKQQIGRPFEPGQSGNPTGRPKGARNKLSEAFLQALAEDFETHGKDTIVKVRTDRPHDYLKIVALSLPRRMEIEDATPDKPLREMTDAELNAILWRDYKELGITEQEVAEAASRRPEEVEAARRLAGSVE